MTMTTEVWGEMAKRLRNAQNRLEGQALGVKVSNTSETTVAPVLTLETLEASMRDIDPDGRRLQEARLLSECSKLSKAQVETLILMAGKLHV
jgi:hypothetical protein